MKADREMHQHLNLPKALEDGAMLTWDERRVVGPRDRLILTAPMLAALIYPILLMALFNSGQVLLAGGGVSGFVLVSASLLLVFVVPMLGLYLIFQLRTAANHTVGQSRARAFAHLVYASPALYTLIGVLLYIAGVPGTPRELAVWFAIWVPICAFIFHSGGQSTLPRATSPTPVWLRFSHGVSAALLLTIFLLLHIGNHVLGTWSAETHQMVMKFLRAWYRSHFVEPVVVVLAGFQIASGAVLLRSKLSQASDMFSSLQTATGAYLGIFIVSHVSAALILARWEMGIDTDFFWASGGKAGLLADAWSVRLIPHYGLAIWGLITHVACGLRAVLLAHAVNERSVNRIAAALSACGAVLAGVIVLALCRVHLG